jgi:putative YhdH/YhfP family quinone oxidoreductase
MPVIVSGYELGAGRWGGWCRFIRVPADWVVPLPSGLTLKTAMMYGTAGFTAAQCAEQLLAHQVLPDTGPVVVTGATGGVGCLAVKLLAMLGYDVTASTGKTDAAKWLNQLGAVRVVSRDAVQSTSNRPLLSARWAGAVDTVGGETLATLVRETQPHGCVAACGLVGGASLNATVYPFILRGVTLAGITAALCPQPTRVAIWGKLAGPWALDDLESLVQVVELSELEPQIERILRGDIRGRVIVRLAGDSSDAELPES